MLNFLGFTKTNTTLTAGNELTGTAEEVEPINMDTTKLNDESQSEIYGGIEHSDGSKLEAIYKKICDKFQQNAEDGEELDIYQVTSFLKYYHPQHSSHRWKYAFYCFKCIICALIQTLGIVAFLNYVIKDIYDEDKIQCNINSNAGWDIRSVATLFSAYISVSLVNILLELRYQGLYENIAYLPSFLANEWVYLGLYCNAFTLMAATYGSFLLIYTADSTIDIVLNSVALYFLIELDNSLVDHFDYMRISDWMKHEFKYQDWFSEQQLAAVKFNKICCIKVQVSGRRGGCNRLKNTIILLGGFFVYFCIYVGAIGAFAAPILIAICY